MKPATVGATIGDDLIQTSGHDDGWRRRFMEFIIGVAVIAFIIFVIAASGDSSSPG